MKNRISMICVALFLAALVAGCTSTQTGAIGAGTGAVIGHQSGHGGEGALIGAGVGALSGAIIGHEIDKSKQQAPPPAYQSGGEYYDSGGSYGGGDYYEGEYDSRGRRWVPEHEEVRVYTAPDGSRYEKRILVPGHYE